MSNSQIWLQHLAASLTASRQAAYLYQVETDKYEFIGDAAGVLGTPEDAPPADKKSFAEMIVPEDVVTRQIQVAEALSKCQEGEKSFTLRYRIKRPDGAIIPLVETGIARTDAAAGKTTIQSLLAIDVAAIERHKKLSRKMGFKETVANVFSGSNDRQRLTNAIDEILAHTERDKSSGYLLLVGVDRVSLVNEVYGGQFTDELLEKIGSILSQLVSNQGELIRISGDVFALLFPQQRQGQMADTAQNVLNVFYNQPIEIQSRFVHQVVSIGGIRLADNHMAGTSALAKAELSLQDAKSRGRGCFSEYSEKMGEEVNSFRNVLSVGDNFLKSFRDGRVKIAFQGVRNSRTNDVSFYECLIRMIDENGEVHSAGRFIEAVEKMGLTRLVDTFATQEAIKELKEFPRISLSVNVSNHTLLDPDWLKAVNRELTDYPDVACRLIVEITESVAMSDINQTLRVVRGLQGLGCRVALDDFGAGQTAFSQLKDLSLDIVKIDKSFVREMGREENKLFIRTLHSLASAMNLETVGEGAETLIERDVLARDGIDHIQGFVHGLPSLDRLWLNESKE